MIQSLLFDVRIKLLLELFTIQINCDILWLKIWKGGANL